MNIENQQIKQIANGNNEAFKTFYERHKSNVYNVALSYVQNIQEAEDITQEVFVSIFKNAASFKGASSVSTWVYRITVNTSLNLLKRKNKYNLFKIRFPQQKKIGFDHPGILMEHKENASFLFDAISKLPDNQKTAFILSFIEQLPRKEVAAIMDLSLKAIEALLHRAKVNLKKKLEKDVI